MEYPLDNQASWKNEVRRRQRASTLKTYVYSEIGHLPVSGVTTALVPKILRPIWTTKSGTASGVRGPAGRPDGAVTLTQRLVRAQQNRFLVDKDNPEHLWNRGRIERHRRTSRRRYSAERHGVRDTERSCGPWRARRQAYWCGKHIDTGVSATPYAWRAPEPLGV